LSVGLTTLPRKKHIVVNRKTKPRDSFNGNQDGKRKKENKRLSIGTWNIRTLFKPGALRILIDEVTRYNLPIVALQDMRWPGKVNIKSENYTIFYSGTENDNHENGVGFLINDSILSNMKKFTAINERLCIIQIQGKIWDIALLNCYAPTEDKNNDAKSKIYERLEDAYESLPGNTVNIIVGDLNAQIGREPNYRPTIGKESLHI
jgi:hypothetical protein